MNPETQPLVPPVEPETSQEKPPAGSFWVPARDTRRDRPVRAELFDEGNGLAARVRESMLESGNAGMGLAKAILNPNHGIVGPEGKVDVWGSARLQIALEEAMQSFRGSSDDLARDAQEVIVKAAPDLVGLEHLADLVRGARAVIAYTSSHPLGERSRRFTSLALDVLEKTDFLEADYAEDGKLEELRFVQVKAGEENARQSVGGIVGTHQKLLSSYLPNLAGILANEEATAERNEVRVSEGRFDAVTQALAASPDALAKALGANPQVHLALRLGQQVRGFQEHLNGTRGRETADQLFRAAAVTPVPLFRIEKLARAGNPPAMSSLVQHGEPTTRFVTVVAAGEREVARQDISAHYFGARQRHPTV